MRFLPHQVNLLVTGAIMVNDLDNPGQQIRKVYQRTARNKGNLPRRGSKGYQLRAYVHSSPGDTPGQLAGRRRMAAAVTAWQGLSEAEKDEYRRQGKPRRRSGYNWFIRQFCRTHPISEF